MVYLLKSSVPDIVINEKNAGNDSKNLVQQIHFGDGVLSLARMLNKQGDQTNVSVLQIRNTNFFKGAASKHKRIFNKASHVSGLQHIISGSNFSYLNVHERFLGVRSCLATTKMSKPAVTVDFQEAYERKTQCPRSKH